MIFFFSDLACFGVNWALFFITAPPTVCVRERGVGGEISGTAAVARRNLAEGLPGFVRPAPGGGLQGDPVGPRPRAWHCAHHEAAIDNLPAAETGLSRASGGQLKLPFPRPLG